MASLDENFEIIMSTQAPRLDISGKRFGLWTAIQPSTRRRGRWFWECECACGCKRAVLGHALRHGTSTSCGCAQYAKMSARQTTHGHTLKRKPSPEYLSWRAAKRRCTNPNFKHYRHYGGRGILMCDAWLGSFEKFLADMGPRPHGTSLDRRDNDGHYCKENCRWADRTTQANNTRSNRWLNWNGSRMTAAQVARACGLKINTLLTRIGRDGMSLEGATSKPVIKVHKILH